MKTFSALPAWSRDGTIALLVLLWSCASIGYSSPTDFSSMLCTGAAILLGTGALGWLRPPRAGLTAPQAMLLLGAIGMIFGLITDSPAQMELLASLCGQANHDLWSTMRLHWMLLPWTHVDMWIGGFAAIPVLRTVRPACKRQYCVRVAQNLACSAWMTVGMSCGVLLFEHLASPSGVRSAAPMFGCMFAGMVWGMVASVALYRLCFQLRPLVAFKSPQGQPAARSLSACAWRATEEMTVFSSARRQEPSSHRH